MVSSTRFRKARCSRPTKPRADHKYSRRSWSCESAVSKGTAPQPSVIQLPDSAGFVLGRVLSAEGFFIARPSGTSDANHQDSPKHSARARAPVPEPPVEFHFPGNWTDDAPPCGVDVGVPSGWSATRTTVPKRPCGKPLLACRQEVTDSRTEQPSHRQFSSEVAPRAYFRALPWTWVPTGDDALVALGW